MSRGCRGVMRVNELSKESSESNDSKESILAPDSGFGTRNLSDPSDLSHSCGAAPFGQGTVRSRQWAELWWRKGTARPEVIALPCSAVKHFNTVNKVSWLPELRLPVKS